MMKKTIKGILLGLGVGAIVLGFIGGKHNFEVSKNIDIFSSIYKELNQYYVDTLIPEKVMRVGIDAMLKNLDPYTQYYPKSESSSMKFLRTGEYGGIGSVISYNVEDSSIIINEPYEGQPAALSGLKAGDVLLEIDGISMKGKFTSDASHVLQGEVGKEVVIRYKRKGLEGIQTLKVKRKKIQINPVIYYGTLKQDSKIGYIRLTTFNNKSASEVKQAFLALKKYHHITSLVFDLRNNGGGLLDQALKIVNFFVPKGVQVLSTKGKIKQWDKTYVTGSRPLDTKMPIAVLVNGNTASASEIVSGALQDLDRAIVVGTRSFGKGLVQTVRDVSYDGQLKLTTGKYYIPSGRCIQEIDYSKKGVKLADSLSKSFYTAHGRVVKDGKGILPDFVVPLDTMRNLSYYLSRKYMFLYYAAYYLQQHETLAPVDSFHLTDVEYLDFISYLEAEKFSYDRQSQKILASLIRTAKFEGYADVAKDELEALKSKFQHNLKREMLAAKEEVKRMLELEIVKQKYYQRGTAAFTVLKDKQVEKSIEILKDKNAYKKTLKID